MENKKEEPTLNKVTFVNGVQIKNKSGISETNSKEKRRNDPS